MFSLGYRPTGNAQQISVVRFVGEALGEEYEDLVVSLERMRRTRNISVYDTPGIISRDQAMNAVERPCDF